MLSHGSESHTACPTKAARGSTKSKPWAFARLGYRLVEQVGRLVEPGAAPSARRTSAGCSPGRRTAAGSRPRPPSRWARPPRCRRTRRRAGREARVWSAGASLMAAKQCDAHGGRAHSVITSTKPMSLPPTVSVTSVVEAQSALSWLATTSLVVAPEHATKVSVGADPPAHERGVGLGRALAVARAAVVVASAEPGRVGVPKPGEDRASPGPCGSRLAAEPASDRHQRATDRRRARSGPGDERSWAILLLADGGPSHTMTHRARAGQAGQRWTAGDASHSCEAALLEVRRTEHPACHQACGDAEYLRYEIRSLECLMTTCAGSATSSGMLASTAR